MVVVKPFFDFAATGATGRGEDLDHRCNILAGNIRAGDKKEAERSPL